MAHRGQRKFPDGMYRCLDSFHTKTAAVAMAAFYGKQGKKTRYLKGEDGKYHVYEKVE